MTDHISLAEALLAFHKNPPHIALDATNPFHKSKFASLQKNNPVIRESLAAQGLVYTQPLAHIGTHPALTTILMHPASGESLESTTPLFLGMKWEKDKESGEKALVEASDPQSHGSAITYARRYALLSILGLVGDEDDDGNAATAPAKAAKRTGGSAPAGKTAPATAADPPVDSGIEFAPELPFEAPGDGVTDPQVKNLGRLMAKLDSEGILTVEKLREGMQSAYGVTSKKELTKKQASDLITRLKSLAGEE